MEGVNSFEPLPKKVATPRASASTAAETQMTFAETANPMWMIPKVQAMALAPATSIMTLALLVKLLGFS